MKRTSLDRTFSLTIPNDLVDTLRRRALHEGDRNAFTLLEERSGIAISYAELDRRARRIGAALQQQARPGQRAILLYQPGLEYLCGLLGCWYAGLVAVPASPPDIGRLDRSLPPLQALVADAQATLALSTRWIVGLAQELGEIAPEVGQLRWVATNTLAEGGEDAWQRPASDLGDLALLAYTAGATRAPRGVLLSHANLLHSLESLGSAFAVSPDTVMVSWLPPYADLGLLAGLLLPIYADFPCFLLEPDAFFKRPLRWLEVVAEQRATISGGPNFAYDLCVRRSGPEERAALDLSAWRTAFNGGEPVRAETLDRFTAAFGPSGFRDSAFAPCYSLTEATCLAASGAHNSGPTVFSADPAALANDLARASAGDQGVPFVGFARPHHPLLIVDPATRRPLPDAAIGEIWLAGPGVGQGYWGRPEETAEYFQARLADGTAGDFLRTGDLGFLHAGRLYVTGRREDMIGSHGQRLYPQFVEQAVAQGHDAIRPGGAVAFQIKRDGIERLVVAAEIQRDGAGSDLAESIATIGSAARHAVTAAHGGKLYALIVLRAGDLPRTVGGKLRRGACRSALLAGTLPALGVSLAESRTMLDVNDPEATPIPSRADLLSLPRTARREPLEAGLRGLVRRLSQTIPAGPISCDAPLHSLGVDALAAVELASSIAAATGVQIAAVQLLDGASLTQVADQILSELAAEEGDAAQAAPAADMASFPLAYGQRAMWFLQQLTPESPVYTLTQAVRFVGELNETAFRRALRKIAERHPVLRTVFAIEDGEPVQRVLEQGEIGLRIEDATAWGKATLEQRMAAEVFRHFDLERGPLLHVTVLRRGPHGTVLLLAAHHIVTDFWSLATFVYEIAALYGAELRGEPAMLPRVTAPYADYVRWEREMIAGPQGERLWQFWREQLGGELPVLDLPTDRPRPQAPTYRGGTRAVRVDPALSRAVRQMARAHGATTFMTVLTAFQVLLHRYSGQDDLIVGVPRAARRNEWSRTLGYLVNPLPIRATLAPEESYAAHLERVRKTATAAFEHAALPFALMVERLQLQRDLSRTPVFQVMLAWQKTVRLGGVDAITQFALNQEGGVLPFGDAQIESLALRERVVPFDLTLLGGEAGDEIFFSFEYNSDLFDVETVDRMLGQLVTLLAGAAADPQLPIGRLPLLSADARRDLLARSRADATAPRPATPIHALFAEQAARRPAAAALCWWEAPGMPPQRMSYAELDRRSSQLASYLQAGGVGPETIVGVCVERSPELIVALLGVLKAGGVFLPLDPAYPQERLRFMLADSRAAALLTKQHLLPALGLGAGQADEQDLGLWVVRLDSDWPQIAAAASAPAETAQGQHAAYIIYTSGSTGTPKGVLIEHAAIAAHIQTTIDHYEITADDRVLQFASLNFDAALEQVFETLLCGAELVLRPDEIWSPEELRHHAIAQGLSVINVPPAYWQQLVAAWAESGEPAHRLRLVIVGGDQIPPESIALWRGSALAGVRLLNAYGPTETTITATTYPFPRAADGPAQARIAIGRPLAGRSAYVLDAHGELVPVGVPGELYLGGLGVARGYLNRPELTAAHFVADRFGERPDGRLYRTGDLVRLRADGNLEFLGRIDQQVKIRGFRVEPGEIESLLRRHPQVADALVVPYGVDDDVRLAAYLLISAGVERARALGGSVTDTPAAPTAGELRSYLRQSLPEFMLPAAFVELDAWPLTPSGKIDRRALPPPEAADANVAAGAGYVAPGNAIEAAIAGLWAELLGQPQVGIEDSFFELGGHSLLATRLITQVRGLFGVDLPLRALFDDPTVAGMARVLLEQLAAGDGEVAALLDQLEGISDEQARELLDEE